MTENSRDTQTQQYNTAETGELAHLYRGEMSPALISRGAFTDAFAFFSKRLFFGTCGKGKGPSGRWLASAERRPSRLP